MAVTISQYLFKKVLRISAFNITTGELYGSMSLLNNVSFRNGQEQTDVTAAGVKIAQLDYGKTSSIVGESALINDAMIGLQSGTTVEIKQNVKELAIPDTLTVTGSIAVAKYKATGVANQEIRYAYLLDNKGAPVKTFKQAAAASAGRFSYTSSTKTLTFHTGEVPDGSKILIYSYPTITEAKLITSDSNKFSMSAKVVAELQVADVCDPSREYLGYIIYENGKFSGSYEWGIDGQNPAVQAFEVSSMLPCGTSKLWDLFSATRSCCA